MTASYAARYVIPGDIIRNGGTNHTVTHVRHDGTTVLLDLADGPTLIRPAGALVTVTTAAPRPRKPQ